MNCPWHPIKRVVSSCKDCGTGFCIECVRETDQTTLCPDCYRRKLSEIAREFTDEPSKEARAPGPSSVSALPREEVAPPAEASPFDDEMVKPAAAPQEKKKTARRRGRDKRGSAPPEPPAPPSDDFLSQGPDEDFSQITSVTSRLGRRPRQDKAAAPPPEEIAEAPVAEDVAAVPPVQSAAGISPAEDVMRRPREVRRPPLTSSPHRPRPPHHPRTDCCRT